MAYTHTPPVLLALDIEAIRPGLSVEHRGYEHRVAAVRGVGGGLYRVYVKVYPLDDSLTFKRFYDVCRSDNPQPPSKVAT